MPQFEPNILTKKGERRNVVVPPIFGYRFIRLFEALWFGTGLPADWFADILVRGTMNLIVNMPTAKDAATMSSTSIEKSPVEGGVGASPETTEDAVGLTVAASGRLMGVRVTMADLGVCTIGAVVDDELPATLEPEYL